MVSNFDNCFILFYFFLFGICVMYICFMWINYNIYFYVIKIMGIKFICIRNFLFVRMVCFFCLFISSKVGFEIRYLVY